MYNMKKNVFLISVVFLFLCLSSCESDRLSSEKQITSYTLDAIKNNLDSDITGAINDTLKTITLSRPVPVIRDLVATFDGVGEVYIGATLQASGVTSNTYDVPLIYTVRAEDGSTVDYTVVSTPMPHAALKHLSVVFCQNGQTEAFPGKFSADSSRIILEPVTHFWIENIDSAVAEFEAEGRVYVDGVEQFDGETANDFRKELIYTVKTEDLSTRSYVVELMAPQTTGLPIVKIETEGEAEIVDKENYLDANFRLIDQAQPEYEIERSTGIRGRGNTTWWYPKKPYRLKFDKKVSLFGLGAAKSWVLLANWLDPTFLMNTVAFEVAHRLGLEYTNHAHHVELFLNNRYQGSYVLTEQVQVNEHRVNIDEDTDFLVELDAYFDEDYKWRTPILGLPANIKSPDLDDEAGMDFVMNAFNALEAAVMDPAFPRTNYAELIDVPTLINYLLVYEIVRNRELEHPKSTYLYKKGTDKIKMGPVWDFDWGFGYTGTGQVYFSSPEGLIFWNKPVSDPGDYPGTAFFMRFFEDPAFREAYKNRWNAVKGQLADLDSFVEGQGEYLLRSGEENRKVWPSYLDYAGEIAQMKEWISRRLQSLDEEINNRF